MPDADHREPKSRPATARPAPCGSCPYRRDAPSGVWDAEEYAKLPTYDGETFEQRPRAFLCHNDADRPEPRLCAGWLGCHGPEELLGVRIGLIEGAIDPSVLDFTTDVPLFESGAAAAAYGLADVDAPSPEAVDVVRKVRRAAAARARR